MTTPAVGVDLLVFIGEYCFKGTTMQIQCDHIRSGKCVLRELGEKQFVDHALASVTDAALFLGSQVGSHDDAARHTRLSHRDIRAVVEGAHQGAFRATEMGIGGQVEPRLHNRVIQHRVVFASHHEAEVGQIRNDRPSAVESIQSQQGACLRQTLGSEIPTNGFECMRQFLSILPVASIPETAEPLIAVGL
jgi:hypothetical protein